MLKVYSFVVFQQNCIFCLIDQQILYLDLPTYIARC